MFSKDDFSMAKTATLEDIRFGVNFSGVSINYDNDEKTYKMKGSWVSFHNIQNGK